MYRIGELSKICKLPVKTLRYYSSIGLLIPDEVDVFTGYRYYAASKIADCNRISALKTLGFSLDEIRRYLYAESAADIKVLIDAKSAELDDVICEAMEQKQRLSDVLALVTAEKRQMFDLVIREADAITVAYRRKVFVDRGEAATELAEMKRSLPTRVLGTRAVIINYETEYRERDFDLALCVEVTGKVPKEYGYEIRTLTFSGDTASVVCKKDELDDAYASMQMQLDARGEQVTGAYYEIYYDDRTVEIKAPLYRASQTDMTELPAFVQDEDAVGKWKFCDIVPSQEQFLYGHRKCNYSTHFDEIYFLEGGEGYWIFGGWTRGYCCTDVSNHGIGRYMIKETDGHKLMFLEMVHGDKRTAPEIWVYEKISDAHLHASDIRRQDFVDYPFVTDEQVLGNWRVKDFYGDEDRAFDPSIQNFPIQELFLLRVSFLPSGVCIHVTKNHEDMLRWTKGYLLNIPQKLASAYEIRVVNGTEYLILEWKSGDYVYGPDASVYHYVFERE